METKSIIQKYRNVIDETAPALRPWSIPTLQRLSSADETNKFFNNTEDTILTTGKPS